MEEINVSLFPPSGAGTAHAQGPGGQILAQCIPAIEFTKVRDLAIATDGRGVIFTTRTGETVKSNLPYIIKTITVTPDHDA